MSRKLTPKQAAFIPLYVKYNNGIKAAKEVNPKYTDQSAGMMACKWLSLDKVRSEIERIRNQVNQLVIVDRARIIQEWDKIAYSDIRATRNENDEVKRIVDMPEDVSAAIEETTEIETSLGSSRKIKMHSKIAALKELAKLAGLYPEEGTGEGVKLSFQFGVKVENHQDKPE